MNKIKLSLLCILLLGSNSYALNSNIKEIIKEAKENGIVNENEVLGKTIVKEDKTISENTIIPGEISEASLKASMEDAKRFKKNETKKEDLDLIKNKETEAKLSKELDLKESFIDKESVGYEKRRNNKPREKEILENVKKIVPLSTKIELLKKAEAFSIGNGNREYYLILDTGDKASVELLKKYTAKGVSKDVKLNIIITNQIFDLEAAKKTTWILLGENKEERLERSKKIFKENSSKYKWFFIYRNIFGITEGIDKVLSILDNVDKIKKTLNISQTPVILDSKLIKRDISDIYN